MKCFFGGRLLGLRKFVQIEKTTLSYFHMHTHRTGLFFHFVIILKNDYFQRSGYIGNLSIRNIFLTEWPCWQIFWSVWRECQSTVKNHCIFVLFPPYLVSTQQRRQKQRELAVHCNRIEITRYSALQCTGNQSTKTTSSSFGYMTDVFWRDFSSYRLLHCKISTQAVAWTIIGWRPFPDFWVHFISVQFIVHITDVPQQSNEHLGPCVSGSFPWFPI